MRGQILLSGRVVSECRERVVSEPSEYVCICPAHLSLTKIGEYSQGRFFFLFPFVFSFFSFFLTKEFVGNKDQDTIEYNELSQPITSRYIRIRPIAKGAKSLFAMRVELYGCPGIYRTNKNKQTTILVN